jgi:hypothetical protein
VYLLRERAPPYCLPYGMMAIRCPASGAHKGSLTFINRQPIRTLYGEDTILHWCPCQYIIQQP